MMVSETTYYICAAFLVFYVFSMVYGRLYTGMHSFTDCTVGALLGAAIWGLFVLFGDAVDTWLKTSGWIGMFSSTIKKPGAQTVSTQFLQPSFLFAFCLYTGTQSP